MAQNPLFPTDEPAANQHGGYSGGMKRIEPPKPTDDRDAAQTIIRQKLEQLYADEPNAKQELAEAESAAPRSKHQEFIHQLSSSGKSLAQIQTEWHNYYLALPDEEKQQVWDEFYNSNKHSSSYHKTTEKLSPALEAAKRATEQGNANKVRVSTHEPKALAVHQPRKSGRRSAKAIKQAVTDKVSARGRLQAKHHLQSLLFGLSMGGLTLIILMFSFFNERIIAPLIQPNRNANAPLILDGSSIAASATPEVIIPKINVEIPVDYSQTTTDESQIENALESGVVHYPITAVPGQNGNAAFFGHSSNNIFNKGKYKFAFVLLHTIVPGDTFYLTKDGKVYVYKVISKNVVPPSDVSVLNPVAGQQATATLITCDPPGTSLNRLIVVGQQISPDPSTNTASTQTASDTSYVNGTDNLPGNGPTLFSRLWHAIF